MVLVPAQKLLGMVTDLFESPSISIQVQTLAFTITDNTYLLIKDLTFFATTLDARSNIHKLELNSLHFKFPTYSRRMLHETDPPKWTKVFAGKGSVRIYNNTFYGTDGIALEYGGVNDTVENNVFEYNDWSGANMVKAQGGMRIRNGSPRLFQPCR